MGKVKKQAQKQLALSQQAAQTQQGINMANQVTPYGNVTWTTDPTKKPGDPGYYVATQTLSPQQQALLDQQSAAQTQQNQVASKALTSVSGTLAKPLTLTRDNPDQIALNKNLDFGGPADLAGHADQRALSYYDDYIAPRVQQDAAHLEQKLANQGIFPGMEAYDRAMKDFQFSTNQDRSKFMLDAQQQGFQQAAQARGIDTGEASTIFNANNQAQQAEAGFNNQANLAAMQANNQAAISERDVPVNEYASLRSGTQVTNPTYVNTPQASVASPDYLGAKTAQNQADAQQNAAMYGAIGSAAGGLASTIKWSDPRLKEDVHKVGKLFGGINAYKYRLKGSPFMQIGVMSDEVEKEMPEAVIDDPSGFKKVNYGAIARRLAQHA